MTDKPMTRAEVAEQIAYLEALAVQAKEAAGVYRDRLKSEAADELRTQGTSASWRVNGLGTIAGREKHDAVQVSDPADFLAWVKAHKPEQVELVERVNPTYAAAVLKGCHLNDEGLLVTAAGDEIAGVKFVRGGQFDGIGITIDAAAKETYAELARIALARIGLTPQSQVPAPAADDGEKPAAVAAFLATPAPADPATAWSTSSTPAPDPWVTSPA